MKITEIQTFILKVPLGEQRFYSSQCAFPERSSMLVRIRTDNGVAGWGEGGQYGPAEPVCSCVEHVLGPRLVDEDPLEPGRLWEQSYAHVRDFGQKGPYIEAMSAIDVALWDICGQHYGEPIYKRLGGRFRETVQAYATGCYYRGRDHLDWRGSLAALADEAAGYVQAGFRMLKAKIGLLPIEADAARLEAVRRAIGAETGLLVDCNHAYNAFTALRAARAMQPSSLLWIEEPVPPEDRDGYRQVRQNAGTAIAGGECEYTRYGFRDLIATGCVDIVQPDICVSGGLSEWQRVVALASSYGVWAIPHVWGSGIALAVALHAVAALPPFPHTAHPVALQNEPVIEYDRNTNPLRDELLSERIGFSGGRLSVPDGPGLGVTINEQALQKYTVYSGQVG